MEDATKLKVLEEEISRLIDYAFDHGIERDRIKELSEISYDEYLYTKRKKNYKIKMFSIFAICLLVVVTAYFLCCSKIGFAFLRISLIKLLPLWDWTSIYKKNCLMPNPLYDKKFDPQVNHDCSTCQTIQVIPKLSNLSGKEALHKYLIPDIPIIISGATNDWPAKKHFTLQFLMRLYLDDPVLSQTPPCLFSSSFDDLSLLSVAHYLTQKHNTKASFYMHWENCEKKAVKVLRSFYRRPAFIHSSVEVAPVNWLAVSTNHETTDFIKTDPETPLSWFAQVKGSLKIRLQASSCNATCTDLYAVLQEGDIVLWTQPHWQFAYKPMKGSETEHSISMLFGGFLD